MINRLQITIQLVNHARRQELHAAPTDRYSISYRLTAKKGLPDVGSIREAVRDLQRAVSWVAKQPGVDSSRIAVFGTSAGGFALLRLER
jgi:acetyl esterase/lipase